MKRFGALALAALCLLVSAPALADGPVCSLPNGNPCPADVQQYTGADGHPANASASSPLPMHDAAPAHSEGTPVTPLGVTPLAVSSSAVAPTIPTGATWCYFKIETAAVRWRDDGTNPTASVGWPQTIGETFTLYVGSLAAVKFIRQSADATVDLACYK